MHSDVGTTTLCLKKSTRDILDRNLKTNYQIDDF